MAISWFRFSILYLSISFTPQFWCTKDVNNCSYPINIYKDFECKQKLKDVESVVQVYCSDTAIREFQAQQQTGIVGMKSRMTAINLVVYPVLVNEGSRYKAHFCVEIIRDHLTDFDSALIVFSARKFDDVVLKSIVFHQRIVESGNSTGKYVRIGCYWHYSMLLATGEVTVQLDVVFFRNKIHTGFGKYYFRIPFWEQFNNRKTVDQCSFSPFVYVEESGDPRTEIIHLALTNCSRPKLTVVNQIQETSGEISKSHAFYMKNKKKWINHLNDETSLHYYQAFFIEDTMKEQVKDEPFPANIVLISILMIAIFIVLKALWCQRVTTRKYTLLGSKSGVKFLYCSDSNFQIYRNMAETFILFLIKYCNVNVAGDLINLNEISKSRFLLENFDAFVLIPFPSSEGLKFDQNSTLRCIKQWEGEGKKFILLELPFWPKISEEELMEICKPFTKVKRFKLMEEFFSFLNYIQRCRSCIQRTFVKPSNAGELQKKLEECNMTNNSFEFCLKHVFDISQNNINFPSFTDNFPNLQDLIL